MRHHVKAAFLIVVSIVLIISGCVTSFAARKYYGDVGLTIEIPDNFYVVSSYGVSEADQAALEEKGFVVDDILKENDKNNFLFQAVNDTFTIAASLLIGPSESKSAKDLTDSDLEELKNTLSENFTSEGKELLGVSKYDSQYTSFLKTEYRMPDQNGMLDMTDYICIEGGTTYHFSFAFYDKELEDDNKRETEQIIDSVRIDGKGSKKIKKTEKKEATKETESAKEEPASATYEKAEEPLSPAYPDTTATLAIYMITNALGFNMIFIIITIVAVLLRRAAPRLVWVIFLGGLLLQALSIKNAADRMRMSKMPGFYALVMIVIAFFGFYKLTQPSAKKKQPGDKTPDTAQISGKTDSAQNAQNAQNIQDAQNAQNVQNAHVAQNIQDAKNDADGFYKECVSSFHQIASDAGYANKGLIFIPELMPAGEKIVNALLSNQYLSSQYGSDPSRYYYAIVGLGIQAGMVIADQWHKDPDALKNGFVDYIIAQGPAEMAKRLMQTCFQADEEKANGFYSSIYSRWLQLHKPYWNRKDTGQYTFYGTLAAYQTGISAILGQYNS